MPSIGATLSIPPEHQLNHIGRLRPYLLAQQSSTAASISLSPRSKRAQQTPERIYSDKSHPLSTGCFQDLVNGLLWSAAARFDVRLAEIHAVKSQKLSVLGHIQTFHNVFAQSAWHIIGGLVAGFYFTGMSVSVLPKSQFPFHQIRSTPPPDYSTILDMFEMNLWSTLESCSMFSHVGRSSSCICSWSASISNRTPMVNTQFPKLLSL